MAWGLLVAFVGSVRDAAWVAKMRRAPASPKGCKRVTFVPSEQTSQPSVMPQMPKFVSVTSPGYSLCRLSAANVYLLVAGECRQPRAAHALQLPQADAPRLQGPNPTGSSWDTHLQMWRGKPARDTHGMYITLLHICTRGSPQVPPLGDMHKTCGSRPTGLGP